MGLDTITKEQFQPYREVQEKEKELQHHEMDNYRNNNTVGFYAIGTVGCGSAATILGVTGSSIPLTVLFGMIATTCGFGAYVVIRDIVKSTKVMGGLEKEIEELKSKPEYRALGEE